MKRIIMSHWSTPNSYRVRRDGAYSHLNDDQNFYNRNRTIRKDPKKVKRRKKIRHLDTEDELRQLRDLDRLMYSLERDDSRLEGTLNAREDSHFHFHSGHLHSESKYPYEFDNSNDTSQRVIQLAETEGRDQVEQARLGFADDAQRRDAVPFDEPWNDYSANKHSSIVDPHPYPPKYIYTPHRKPKPSAHASSFDSLPQPYTALSLQGDTNSTPRYRPRTSRHSTPHRIGSIDISPIRDVSDFAFPSEENRCLRTSGEDLYSPPRLSRYPPAARSKFDLMPFESYPSSISNFKPSPYGEYKQKRRTSKKSYRYVSPKLDPATIGDFDFDLATKGDFTQYSRKPYPTQKHDKCKLQMSIERPRRISLSSYYHKFVGPPELEIHRLRLPDEYLHLLDKSKYNIIKIEEHPWLVMISHY